MDPKKMSVILLIALLLFFVLGVKTLLPSQSASKPCLLGYKAACSFTPISSLILFWIGAVIFSIRVRVMNETGMKAIPVWLIALSVLCLVGIIFYSYRYLTLKKSSVSKITSAANVTGVVNLADSSQMPSGESTAVSHPEETEARPMAAQDHGRNLN